MFGFPSFLMSDAERKRREEWRQRYYARLLEKAQHFADIKPSGGDLMIRAETYAPENPMALVFPDAPLLPRESAASSRCNADNSILSPSGRFAYQRRMLPGEAGLFYVTRPDDEDPPRVYFTQDVEIPRLAENVDHDRDGVRWKTWMSTTPAEIWSQRSGIRRARDTTVVGGLGMGWQLAQIAKRKQVKRLIVVEKSQELLDWYGYDLCKQLGVDEVICDDVWDVFPRFRDQKEKTRFVLDIWPGFWDARWDDALVSVRRQGFNVWAWGSPRGGSEVGR